MSPEEARMLANQLTNLSDTVESLGSAVRDLGTVVGRVDERTKAHEREHRNSARDRHLTCPTMPYLRDLGSNTDGIAGIQRRHGELLEEYGMRVGKLESWKRDVSREDDIGQARQSVMLRPFRWAWINFDKVWPALVIAYMLARFGW